MSTAARPPPASPGARPWRLLAVFVAFSLAIGAIGTFAYRTLAADIRQESSDDLATVAEFKVREIETWLAHRRALVQIPARSPLFIEAVATWQASGDRRIERQLAERLGTFQDADTSSSVELLDLDGRTLLSAGSAGHDAAWLRPAIAAALKQADPLLIDLHRHANSSHIHVGYLVPLRTPPAATPTTLLLYSLNPESELFPLIQAWPQAGTNGEIALVRWEGNEAVYLNQLPGHAGAPLELREPLTRTELPTVQALLRGPGAYSGRDHHDRPVLAAARTVAGTPWLLVAKLDEAAVTAALRKLTLVSVALVVLAILVAGGLLFALWRQQQLREAAERAAQARTLRDSEERYRVAT